MEKYVRYLYEYQNEKRVQNLGFVKVEESKDSVVIQIYGKGFPAADGQTLEIFLFYTKEGQCIGLPVAQIKGRRPMLNYQLKICPADVGGVDKFNALGGVILKNMISGQQRFYAATWNEENVNVESMRNESEEPVEADEIVEETEEPIEVEEVAEEPAEEVETVESVQTEQASENRNLVYKITRQDLARLPRQEWKLANNHFLMHGCRNFHHLVSFEKDGTCWLGVPGIYHPQEEKAAHAFGFGQFMVPDEGEITLSEDEQTSHGDFGYWCRSVSSVIRK